MPFRKKNKKIPQPSNLTTNKEKHKRRRKPEKKNKKENNTTTLPNQNLYFKLFQINGERISKSTLVF